MLTGGLRSKNRINKPLLTIITVVYNGEKFLERTLNSIIHQSFNDYELIIIDGGSTDKTLEIIKRFNDKIDFWLSEKDNGIYHAMNKGISFASGEWLNFMNCSDIYTTNTTLEEVFRSKLNFDNIKILYSDWYICDALNPDDKLVKKSASWDKGNILHQSIIYRKNLHETLGSYVITNKKFVSDYFFFLQIPTDAIQKTETIISINDTNGVSYGSWCIEQKIVLDYIAQKSSLTKFIGDYIILLSKKVLKKLLRW